ncbi:MAG: efflux RND transporter periplasmic adaptor subunit [Hyphomicrobiaceae bacterium]
MRAKLLLTLAAGVAVAGTALAVGLVSVPAAETTGARGTDGEHRLAAAVSVTRVASADFIATAFVTGSLVPREEILVGPEVEGLRVTEVLADEGDRVTKGQVLARLVQDTLDAQLAQNAAGLARAEAAIAQARSSITQAEARVAEAANAFDRAKPLKQSGYLADSVYDQRESAAKTAQAQLVASRDGLRVAEADKAQIEAQRRELTWRRGRTEVAAPADGVVSRRSARIGAYASGAAEPMFRIIAKGEIELDAEATEATVARIKPGQDANVDVTGAGTVRGRVRLVSPEIDKATRLGRVRIFLGDNPELRIGSFARGTVETARGRGLAVPASAVLYGSDGAHVQVVRDNKVETRSVAIGLRAGANVEIASGLAEGEFVVTKSGTFLRDGDAVRPIVANQTRLSEAAR